MNISGLIRSLVGDLQVSDSKTLELKVGEIVRGVVLQMLSDQDALININGVQVRAKLETPLKQGDVTMLQVQPESNGSQILLKPLASSDVTIADESMKDLLKSFTLKDIPVNRQMVQQMQQEGVPLAKETVKAFAAIQQSVPEGVSQEEWTHAAVLAFKRGLPLTPDTVSALRQATSGQPAGVVFERLEQQVAGLLKEQPGHSAASTLTQLDAALKNLRASAAAAWTAMPPEPAAAAPATAAPAAPQPGGDAAKASVSAGTPQPPGGSADAPAAARPAASPGEAARPASAAQEAASSAATAKPAAQAQALQPDAAARAGAVAAQPQSAEPEAAAEPPQAGSGRQQPPALPEAASAAARPQAQAASPQPAAPDSNWIGRMLQSLGVDHEHQIAKMAEKPELLLRSSPDQAGLLSASADALNSDSAGKQPAVDTVKSMLLQLAATDDLPAPLKEAAQQALQQITGQQLLLSGDRSSMFTHVTMFIPFMDGSVQQSASVHIQSRKGSRGELDANNCRLLFDLQMKTLGNTLVDVQVVNKIVSLQVHNDQAAVADLIDSSREEIAASLSKVGYQFFSLKCLPYPQPIIDKDAGSMKNAAADGMTVDMKSLYEPKPYKGVDYRA
jgi:hypothetical protein